MFTIAVCDDDMQERMQEVQIVKNIFSQKELEAGIEEFQTGQHFLDVLHRVPYDIVLLDIQMGEVSGFMLAEELYKITGGENIIFVSSMENLVFESIHFRPFRFVRKSHLEEELTEAVESWIQQNTKTECLEFDERGYDDFTTAGNHLHRSTKPSFVCPHTERSIKGPRKNFGFRISG